ncbi:hypothetical protein CH063_02715 [Colletotrichum higginsianum]|uniref:Uncharacterized protein n=1 Tax=Colletotrichum higginsianum (strain IMI 349063) TaxID=759273 RepID=H1VNW8_COLHI|nr:hypothetical protein CH063_02715 [Colletotrichum higginsianum]
MSPAPPSARLLTSGCASLHPRVLRSHAASGSAPDSVCACAVRRSGSYTMRLTASHSDAGGTTAFKSSRRTFRPGSQYGPIVSQPLPGAASPSP